MLLPDNIQPELSIYYNGSLVLNELKKKNNQTLMSLYQSLKKYRNVFWDIYTVSRLVIFN